VVVHHEAAIAFPGMLLYCLFCRIEETLLPLSVTPMQFTGNDPSHGCVAATFRESPNGALEFFDANSQWCLFRHATFYRVSYLSLATAQTSPNVGLESCDRWRN